jgi:hypothetical protein
MLIANGAASSSQSVWQQAVNVLPHTTYMVSFYLAEISNPGSVADIAVYLAGNQIGHAVAPGTKDTWNFVTYSWNLGSLTSTTLALKDLNIVAGFNDFAIDNISMTTILTMQASIIVSNQLALSWPAARGQLYQLQYTTDLSQAQWANLGTPIMATNTVLSRTNAIGPDKQRFYRVLQQ